MNRKNEKNSIYLMGKKFTMRYKNKLCDLIKSTILLRSTMTIVAGRVTTKFQRRINCKIQGVNRKLNHNIIVIAAHVQYVAFKWVNRVPIQSLTVITSHHIANQQPSVQCFSGNTNSNRSTQYIYLSVFRMA